MNLKNRPLLLVIPLYLALSLNMSALQPAIEFRFNEEGRNLVKNGGSESLQGEMKSKDGNPRALYCADGEGVSGKPGDYAFNNSEAEGMGDRPGGVVMIPYDVNLIDGATSFTITGWYKTTEGTPIENNAVLLNLGSDDKTCGIILRAHNRGTAALQGRVNGELLVVSPLNAFPETNRWVFFAFTCDLTRTGEIGSYLYHGSEENEVAIVAKGKSELSKVVGKDKPISIGAISNGSKPFKGLLDNIRIYISSQDGSAALPLKKLEEIRRYDLENP